MGALFTTVSSIRVSTVSRVGRVRVTPTVTVRVSRVNIMVSVRDSVNAGDIDPAAGPITGRLLVRLPDK